MTINTKHTHIHTHTHTPLQQIHSKHREDRERPSEWERGGEKEENVKVTPTKHET